MNRAITVTPVGKKLRPSCLANITQDPGGVLRLKLHFWQFAAISGELARQHFDTEVPLSRSPSRVSNLVLL